jgi:hypothetical protein
MTTGAVEVVKFKAAVLASWADFSPKFGTFGIRAHQYFYAEAG